MKKDLPGINRDRAFRIPGGKRSYHESIDFIRKRDGAAAAYAFTHAIEGNIRPNMRRDLAPITAAIRQAEGGRPGLDYGVVDADAKDKKYTLAGSGDPRLGNLYRNQAGWAAATVQKNWDRYVAGKDIKGLVDEDDKPRVVYGNRTDPSIKPLNMDDFIKHFHQIYAPPGVDNDPEDKNVVWGDNVTSVTGKILKRQAGYNSKHRLLGPQTNAQIMEARKVYSRTQKWWD